MKLFKSLSVFALCCASLCGQVARHPFATHVERFHADVLRSLGVPVPPQTGNALIVFASGLEPNASYRIVFAYSTGSNPQVASTQDIISTVDGTLWASFTSPDIAANIDTANIIGWTVDAVTR